MEYLVQFFDSFWFLLSSMAPFLVFGFVVAGILHAFVPEGKIYKHLSKRKFSSVVKASVVGVPLPLCSCGVIPVASMLEKKGASRGAVVSFLSSTPSTGVDSIFATYSLLGPVFAVVRPISAFVSGIFSGALVNVFDKNSKDLGNERGRAGDEKVFVSLYEKVKKIFSYGFYELPEDTGKYILIGIIIGAFIDVLLPQTFFTTYFKSPFLGYGAMVIVGLPMYICATGSIPVAATLIAKGLSPGAGLVFLITGPATNTATMSFLAGKFGKKTLFIYLLSIILVAVLSGVVLDSLMFSFDPVTQMKHGETVFGFLKTVLGIILLVMLMVPIVKKIILKIKKSKPERFDLEVQVGDMSCKKCAARITDSILSMNGKLDFQVDIESKTVKIRGKTEAEDVKHAIEKAGYSRVKFLT